MMSPDESKVLVTQNVNRLVIRDIDSRLRPIRIAISLPLVVLGLSIIFVVFSGAGMAEAHDAGQWIGKTLFLGAIAFIFGMVPLAVGLRLWFIREEITIDFAGGFTKCYLLGCRRFGRRSVNPVSPSDFRVETRCGPKAGSSHEVILRSSGGDIEIRFLSLKTKQDAERWLETITSRLIPNSGGSPQC